jgi:fatty acid desaturase
MDCDLRPGTYRNPKKDWAIDQILGSNDFTHGDHRSFGWLCGHLTGGLGYQIEHHLFPISSHTRLPDIYDFVVPLCREWGINHVCHDNWWKAAKSHHALLRHCGIEEWNRRQKK